MHVSLWWMRWGFSRSPTPFFRWQLRAEVILSLWDVFIQAPLQTTGSHAGVLTAATLFSCIFNRMILPQSPIQINPSRSFLFSSASIHPPITWVCLCYGRNTELNRLRVGGRDQQGSVEACRQHGLCSVDNTIKSGCSHKFSLAVLWNSELKRRGGKPWHCHLQWAAESCHLHTNTRPINPDTLRVIPSHLAAADKDIQLVNCVSSFQFCFKQNRQITRLF